MQTIRNTDLEYIKELGSGTYGIVFYGKWNGSDVAIKRIKPSCFTEVSSEKDRLVITHFLPTLPMLKLFCQPIVLINEIFFKFDLSKNFGSA